MDPKLWGSSAWRFLHIISLNYPNTPGLSDKNDYKNFLFYFSKVIPCDKCRFHFDKLLSETNLNLILSSKEEFFKWTVDIHNSVNLRLNKKQVSYEQALMDTLSSRRLSDKIIYFFELFLLVIFILFLFCFRRN